MKQTLTLLLISLFSIGLLSAQQTYVELETTKAIGSTLEIGLDASSADKPGVWIDLNNNGTREDNEAVPEWIGQDYETYNYTIQSKVIRIYGKIKSLDLDESYSQYNHNDIFRLDVSKCPTLENLDMADNAILSLDVSKNPNIKRIIAKYAPLRYVNLSNGNNDQLNSVDFYHCSDLYYVQHDKDFTPSNPVVGSYNSLTSGWRIPEEAEYVDYRIPNTYNNPYMTLVSSTGSINLYLEAAAQDQDEAWLDLNNNGEKDPGEDNFAFGTSFNVSRKVLTVYGKITNIGCRSSNLIELNVVNNPYLQDLDCAKNKLVSLNVTKNKNLETLTCFENNLYSLDLSHCFKLKYVSVGDNKLKKLDLANGKNGDLILMEAGGNPKLKMIQHDAGFVPPTYQIVGSYWQGWQKDTQAQWTDNADYQPFTTFIVEDGSSDLRFFIKKKNDTDDCWIDLNDNGIKESGLESDPLSWYDGHLSSRNLIPIASGSHTITIYGDVYYLMFDDSYARSVTSIDLSNLPNLYLFENKGRENSKLNCKAIDVSNNPKLEFLRIQYARLMHLDLSYNPRFHSLVLDGNELTYLDLSNNHILYNFYCAENNLKRVKVQDNYELYRFNCFGNQLDACELNKIYASLPYGGGVYGGGEIYVDNGNGNGHLTNPGNLTSNTSIATQNGWKVTSPYGNVLVEGDATGCGGTGHIDISPAPNYHFGDVKVGNVKTKDIVISNTGSTDVLVAKVSCNNPAFTSNLTPFTIPGGESAVIPVAFEPATVGLQTGTLTIVTSVSIYSLALKGKGNGTPLISIAPESLYFGKVVIGESATKTFTVENVGNEAVNITNITSNDDQFSVSPSNMFINTGQSKQIHVTFTPEETHYYYESITLKSDAGNYTLEVGGAGKEISSGMDKENTGQLIIYPNPAHEIITVILPEGTPTGILEVKDVFGKTLLLQNIANKTTKINVSFLKTGVYFVKVNKTIQKLIIK